eukprot:scaffold224286_cov24-Tisochrysis_lutea.AAC.2
MGAAGCCCHHGCCHCTLVSDAEPPVFPWPAVRLLARERRGRECRGGGDSAGSGASVDTPSFASRDDGLSPLSASCSSSFSAAFEPSSSPTCAGEGGSSSMAMVSSGISAVLASFA